MTQTDTDAGLSPENAALIEREFREYVPMQVRDAAGFLNRLLNAAREEGRYSSRPPADKAFSEFVGSRAEATPSKEQTNEADDVVAR